jgi:hypothetical protein
MMEERLVVVSREWLGVRRLQAGKGYEAGFGWLGREG